MSKPVIVLGAGGHAAVLIDTLRLTGREVLCIVDDNDALAGQQVLGVGVQSTAVLDQTPADSVELVNAIGSIRAVTARQTRHDELIARGFAFAAVIHPSAAIAPSAAVQPGAQVMAGAVVQSRATLGRNALVNTRAAIDHDCVIGDHAHIAPGATLSGSVRVGQNAHIGVGATVMQGIAIGQSATVGAGAVVVNDVADGATVVGVPAKPR